MNVVERVWCGCKHRSSIADSWPQCHYPGMEVHFSPQELEEAMKYIDWHKAARTLDPNLPYRQEEERRRQKKTDNLRDHTRRELKRSLRRGL